MSDEPSGPTHSEEAMSDTVAVTTGPVSRDSSAAPMRTGALFADRYQIIKQIGQGGMGQVFCARDERVGDMVALKKLHFLSTDRQTIERFRREVRLARRVSHNNVARIYDLGQEGELLYLSMEYIDGRDLEQLRREKGQVPLLEVIRIGQACARGLQAAHAANVIHQDLKPANIMQDRTGRIVLTDFGIAAGLDDAQTSVATSEVLGSPAYMAPERVEGAKPDRRSDIYSLGVVLYELLSGTLPFSGKTALEMAMARLQAPPRTLPQADGVPYPAQLVQLIMACLERDPSKRPESATAILEALSALAPEAESSGIQTRAPAADRLYAPILRDVPTIRVRPFQYRGSADTNYLGQGISEELVDTLSRTRGLRVIATIDDDAPGATTSPQTPTVVVDGTVHRQGNRFRIIVRLTNALTQTQLWSEVFQTEFEDLFVAQELIAQRVAESLRLEVQAAAQHQSIPPEVVELYLKARLQFRKRCILGPDGAIALLERCLAQAPDFKPAISWMALARSRSFWDANTISDASLAEIEEQVEAALTQAPLQAESHLAAAVFCSQQGDYRKTAQHLADCLEVAPTCAEAHCYLGELQCATGLRAEGLERLLLSEQLDPRLAEAVSHPVLRGLAYAGDWDAIEQALERAITTPTPAIPLTTIFFRLAMWNHRMDWLKRVSRWAIGKAGHSNAMYEQGLRYTLGEIEAEAFDTGLRSAMSRSGSLRFRSLLLQVLTETHCFCGQHELAIVSLEDSVATKLIDSEWIDRCPLLEPLHRDARFQRLADIVHTRAAAVWVAR